MSTVSHKAPREGILLCDAQDGIATLTLNRPEARNALTSALLEELQIELERIASDNTIKVVVIAARGPAFCSGHDMKELRSSPELERYQTLFAQSSRLMITIIHVPQPVLAKVQGPATAAGCQLVATCDLAIASRNSRFSTPGVNIGLFCSTPMVALSRAVGRKNAMEMLLTGKMVDAERAAEIGLINQVVEEAELDEVVEELAKEIASKPHAVVRLGKQAFYHQLGLELEAAYASAWKVMARNMTMPVAEEGIDAFLGKRPPKWEE